MNDTLNFVVIRALHRTPEQLRKHVEKYRKARTEWGRNYLVGKLLKHGGIVVGHLASTEPPLQLLTHEGKPITAKMEPGDVIFTAEQAAQFKIVSNPDQSRIGA